MRGGRPPRSRSRCGRPSRTSSVALERILDQPRAADLLRRALATDRVAHAYAFVGPPGAGRMTTALAFAQALLCTGGREAGAVGGGPESRRRSEERRVGEEGRSRGAPYH